METLEQAVRSYAERHGNRDGLALTPIDGVKVICVHAPRGPLHSVYRPLVCFVLQGAKHMTVGLQEQLISAGQSVLVTADMPVTGRIVKASSDEPYLALAVELQVALLAELATTMELAVPTPSGETASLLSERTERALLDCAARLFRMVETPEAIPLLKAGIVRELHYWLLSGRHGAALRSLAAPDSNASRLSRAIEILRSDFRSQIRVERLASAAAMSPTAFHKHFKKLTSLSPLRYQQRLRLLEARRLMLDEGRSASSAAFEVGYESVSQFTREYRRLFEAPPKRDALNARRGRSIAPKSECPGKGLEIPAITMAQDQASFAAEQAST